MTALGAARADFRRRLVDTGHLFPTGPAGVQGWSGEVEDLRAGISRLAVELGRQLGARRRSYGPVLPAADIVETSYLASFPQLIGSLDVFAGTDREHRRLLQALDRGEDWTAGLHPSGLMMVAAACHPLYASLRGTEVEDARYELRGTCFRHEPSDDPYRGVTFSMHEVVAIGSAEHARRHREAGVDLVRETLVALGLDVRVESANDPFFGRAGRLLAAGQLDQELKVELTVAAYGEEHPRTAIASVNLHEDHFGAAFDIRTPTGAPAHSACLGFGLERIALALLATHGLDLRDWDAGLRGRLGLP